MSTFKAIGFSKLLHSFQEAHDAYLSRIYRDNLLKEYPLLDFSAIMTVLAVYIGLLGSIYFLMRNRVGFTSSHIDKIHSCLYIALLYYYIRIVLDVVEEMGLRPVSMICANSTIHHSLMDKMLYNYLGLIILESFDSILIALEGSTNRITLLHVVYHVGMILLWWANCAYNHWAETLYSILINVLFRFLVYSFYISPTLLSDMGESFPFLKLLHSGCLLGLLGSKIHYNCQQLWLNCASFAFFSMIFLLALFAMMKGAITPVKKVKSKTD